MTSGEYMRNRSVLLIRGPSSAFFCKSVVAICLLSAAALPLQAREAPLIAVELYNTAGGAAYVQISDVLINGKNELRACGSEPTIDKSAYGKLDKVDLASGATLEYRSDGTLALTKDGQTTCVVPSNLKFEKNTSPTPAALAERAVLLGKVLNAPVGVSTGPPPLVPGVKLVFVSEADVELAEYLRADRASTVTVWRGYLKLYPSSPHLAAAKQALCLLLTKDGVESLTAYRKSLPDLPSYDDLRNAKIRSDEALVLTASDPGATHLRSEVLTEVALLTETPQHELGTYREAILAHKSGYSHLLAAHKLTDAAVGVDPSNESLVKLQSEVDEERAKIQSSLQSAESFVAAQQLDRALAAIADYLAFADEEPRSGRNCGRDVQIPLRSRPGACDHRELAGCFRRVSTSGAGTKNGRSSGSPEDDWGQVGSCAE